MKKLDNIHYNLSKILSYNKPFNLVISEREAGKSTSVWLLVWHKFLADKPSIALRRKVIDITPAYINDTLKIFKKFIKGFDMALVKYNRGDCKEGIVDVFYDEKLLFRIIGLSKDLYALKGLVVENIGLMIFDEFICNTRLGEKYLKDEAFKFKELYNTFQRECEGTLRVIFMGNPYSLYNPYFNWLGIDTTLLRPGSFLIGETYAIECYKLTDELKEAILKKNPLYQFDDAYTKYAFNGQAINDINIRINKERPSRFRLIYAFRIEGELIGIFENQDFTDYDTKFYAEEINDISARKNIYCFNFNDLLDRTALISRDQLILFQRFKRAFNNRQILFNNLDCYYKLEEIYTQI